MPPLTSDNHTAAQDEAEALLRQRHHFSPTEADDFSIRNLQEIFAAQEASASIMSLMLAGVASVSLILGGMRDHEHYAGFCP